MAALTAPRNTPRLGEQIRVYDLPVKGATKLWQGSLIGITAAGYLVPMAATSTLRAAGRCPKTIDNLSGADGAVRAAYEEGVFLWDNSASGDLITLADVGNNVYAVDDHTVAKTDNSAARPVAGKVRDIAPSGQVWVQTSLAQRTT